MSSNPKGKSLGLVLNLDFDLGLDLSLGLSRSIKKFKKVLVNIKNGLIIDENGYKMWFKDNQLHREEGPALEYPDGTKFWYIRDRLHRLDGPAIESPDGEKSWYYQDEEIACSSQQEFERLIKKIFNVAITVAKQPA